MAHAIDMDVHIPAAITAGLRRRDIDVLTSQEDGTNRLDDAALIEQATQLGRILFSEDTDLLAIAQECQATGRRFAVRSPRGDEYWSIDRRHRTRCHLFGV